MKRRSTEAYPEFETQFGGQPKFYEEEEGQMNIPWEDIQSRSADTYGRNIKDESETLSSLKKELAVVTRRLNDNLLNLTVARGTNSIDRAKMQFIVEEILRDRGLMGQVNWFRVQIELNRIFRSKGFEVAIQDVDGEQKAIIRVFYMDTHHMEDVELDNFCALQYLELKKLKYSMDL
jgi:hypothetical protein